MGKEFNNAHLDTSFVSMDPKIMKLLPIEGTRLKLTTALNSIDHKRPLNHSVHTFVKSIVMDRGI